MSGPFGVNMTVISGQESSAEIAVAASTFLSMTWLAIRPIGKTRDIRTESLRAIESFGQWEKLNFYQGPDYFVERLTEPADSVSSQSFFWLALDQEGESIARDIFKANGELPDKRVHQDINKLNLIEQEIPPPLSLQSPLKIWKKLFLQYFSPLANNQKKRTKETYSYMSRNARLTLEEKLYFEWCESLYMSLIPWRDRIRNIQSDLS